MCRKAHPMPVTRKFIFEEKILVVESTGYYANKGEIVEQIQSIMDVCEQKGVRLLLGDDRKLEYRLSIFAVFEGAEFLSLFRQLNIRVAVLPHPQFAEKGAFFEDSAVNRGFQIQFFRDEKKAREWLMFEAPRKTQTG
jgi:hypothetical protein